MLLQLGSLVLYSRVLKRLCTRDEPRPWVDQVQARSAAQMKSIEFTAVVQSFPTAYALA
jgi:hypothetical protein